MTCEVGVGVCRLGGIFTCDDDERSLICLTMRTISPEEELCDDLDNDCDGQVDERLVGCCIEGDVRECGGDTGLCTLGQQVCDDGGWSSCDGVRPVSELCDDEDNDCDGLSDERLLNACGGCGATPIEVCDEVDNDCDAQVDEGVLNACGGCGATPVEVCDEVDNDCDAQVDEGVFNACGGCGATPVEVCDGMDNDCDTQVDEAFPSLGEACTAGQGICAREGISACAPQGGVICDATLGPSEAETCDEVDNDCDGQVDEAFNLSTDEQNCGACGVMCVFSTNLCLAGQCFCGQNRSTCPPGHFCNSSNLCQLLTFP